MNLETFFNDIKNEKGLSFNGNVLNTLFKIVLKGDFDTGINIINNYNKVKLNVITEGLVVEKYQSFKNEDNSDEKKKIFDIIQKNIQQNNSKLFDYLCFVKNEDLFIKQMKQKRLGKEISGILDNYFKTKDIEKLKEEIKINNDLLSKKSEKFVIDYVISLFLDKNVETKDIDVIQNVLKISSEKLIKEFLRQRNVIKKLSDKEKEVFNKYIEVMNNRMDYIKSNLNNKIEEYLLNNLGTDELSFKTTKGNSNNWVKMISDYIDDKDSFEYLLNYLKLFEKKIMGVYNDKTLEEGLLSIVKNSNPLVIRDKQTKVKCESYVSKMIILKNLNESDTNKKLKINKL